MKSLDLIVSDVRETGAFLREVANVEPRFESDRFAEFQSGEVTIMLSPDALVDVGLIRGVILHFEVSDPDEEGLRLANGRYNVMRQPFDTDWGTRSLLVQGPDRLVVDLYRSR